MFGYRYFQIPPTPGSPKSLVTFTCIEEEPSHAMAQGSRSSGVWHLRSFGRKIQTRRLRMLCWLVMCSIGLTLWIMFDSPPVSQGLDIWGRLKWKTETEPAEFDEGDNIVGEGIPLDLHNWRSFEKHATDTRRKTSDEPTRTQRIFSTLASKGLAERDCWDLWLSKQELCKNTNFRHRLFLAQSPASLDVVWTWVNGTSEAFVRVRDRYVGLLKPKQIKNSSSPLSEATHTKSQVSSQRDSSSVNLPSTAQPSPTTKNAIASPSTSQNRTDSNARSVFVKRNTNSGPNSSDKTTKKGEPESASSKRPESQSQEDEKPSKKPSLVLGTATRHFRDHDELRYSMRSVLASLGPSKLIRNLQLFTVDFSHLELRMAGMNPGKQNTRHRRHWGSVPSWLAPSARSGLTPPPHQPPLRVRHHSEAHSHDFGNRSPTFSSFAIEALMTNLDDLKDTVLYLNDDYFLLHTLSMGDLESILYGPVFHLQLDLAVGSRNPWGRGRADESVVEEGEWAAMRYSNALLDARFGARERCYLLHFARTMSMPIVREIAMVWEKEFAQTAKVQFRSRGPEVYTAYMHVWYTIEKHRESLLYSFINLRTDADRDGQISHKERQQLLRDLDITSQANLTVNVSPEGRHKMTDIKKNFEAHEMEPPLQTHYYWTSTDGFPLHMGKSCTLNVDQCFGFSQNNHSQSQSADELFKRIAFEKVECGDCLIKHLMAKGGSDAFLPPQDHWVYRTWPIRTRAHAWKHSDIVGAGPDWRQGSFSNVKAVRWMGARNYALRLLQRYQYALGHSNATFVPLWTVNDANILLTPLRDPSSPAAYLTVNDDLEDPRQVELVEVELRKFYRSRFDKPVGWWEASNTTESRGHLEK